MKRFICCLFLFLMVALHTVSADTIYLKTGDQAIGTIIFEDEEKYIIETYNGTPLPILKEYVESVVRSGELTSPASDPGSATGNIQSATLTEDATSTLEQIPDAFPNDDIPLGDGAIEETPPSGLKKPLLPTILPSSNAYIVVGNGVALRSGPGIDSERVASIPGRSLVIGMDQSQGWVHVKTTDDQEGWIHPNFLNELESTPAMVTSGMLNVYAGPDDIFQSITRLRRGNVVMKVQEQENWWRVLTNDQQAGWCNSQYLMIMEDESLYRPQMMTIRNSDIQNSGRQEPVTIQRIPEGENKQNLTFQVNYEPLLMNAMTKLIVFYKDRDLFESAATTYSSADILSRERLPNSSALVEAGFPEELAIQFIGADVLTMESRRVNNLWEMNLIAPDSNAITYAMIVQQGEQRGMMVLME